MGDLSRDLGNLEGRFDALEKQVSEMGEDVKKILERTNVAKGGLKMLLAVGGFAAAVTEGVHWLIAFVHGGNS